ncbi:Predicted ATPase [Vibrio xiamenensis]|uniref:Predicted ATPase n=2 Tax=Vibrio xiamenensis TaxID=861298 RepID=A0A1G8FHA3_9VIBR|nr:Predicted ATPase [Vibrio xiamenensis]
MELSNLESKLCPFDFKDKITIFVGENGCGKSTFLEAIAIGFGCNPEGGGRNYNFNTENTHSDFYEKIILSRGYKKPNDIYFYRAESFYNVSTEIRRLDSEPSFDPEIKTYYGGSDLHKKSHGEAMESLFNHRFNSKGLYILDEPEASLSPAKQLTFVKRIVDLSKLGCQFIIASHSPIIMSTPGSGLYLVDDNMRNVDFHDTEAFIIYKSVLQDGKRFMDSVVNK